MERPAGREVSGDCPLQGGRIPVLSEMLLPALDPGWPDPGVPPERADPDVPASATTPPRSPPPEKASAAGAPLGTAAALGWVARGPGTILGRPVQVAVLVGRPAGAGRAGAAARARPAPIALRGWKKNRRAATIPASAAAGWRPKGMLTGWSDRSGVARVDFFLSLSASRLRPKGRGWPQGHRRQARPLLKAKPWGLEASLAKACR
jgi:hypothetical protein